MTRAPDSAQAESTAAMYAAARLYHEEGLAQHEVAERLGVSRSTVSRLLRQARDHDIVRIEVRPPSAVAELSVRLAGALDLRRAVVVPALAQTGGRQALVEPALRELGRLGLGRGDVLAVSWGQTVWEIAQAQRFPALGEVRIVPAIGGMDEGDVRFQTNEIARRMAAAGGAEVSFLHAPALPSARLRRSLLADPDTAARLALWDRLAAVVVGVGLPPARSETGPAHAVAHRAGLAGAVGDVVSRHYDLAGEAVTFRDEDRMLGVTRAQLRAAGTVIAVAAGTAKAPSVVGAARAGLIDVLVTDAATAGAALELSAGG
ncbi:MAG: transcriptional regulator [Solirubrobacterales bacterium]|nr:transcriptional regulator [Solirubrobacterales bacterium]